MSSPVELKHFFSYLFDWLLRTRRLAIIPQIANVLKTMLSSQQPRSFLECSARTLSYLSTRVLHCAVRDTSLCADIAAGTALFRPLMSFADDVPESDRDFSKLPQVERMCALLLDPSRTGVKVGSPNGVARDKRVDNAPDRVTQFAGPSSPLSSRSQWHTTTP